MQAAGLEAAGQADFAGCFVLNSVKVTFPLFPFLSVSKIGVPQVHGDPSGFAPGLIERCLDCPYPPPIGWREPGSSLSTNELSKLPCCDPSHT